MELDPVCRAFCRSLIAPARPATHDVPPSGPQIRRHPRRYRSGQVAGVEVVPHAFTREEQVGRM
eukprot:4275404-Alexandrium_andersonii.AAC.1